jgi:dTMP kinase
MNFMYPFILFEGLDRTGKTTVAKRIAQELGGVYLHSPPEVLMPFRKGFDAQGSDELNFAFYLVGNHILNQQIVQAIQTQLVVCDRHFPSTVASHSDKLGRNLDHHLEEMNPLPDRVYYFFADIGTIIERDKASGGVNERFYGREYWERVMANYDRIFSGNPGIVRIDTTHRTIDEVYELVLGDIRNTTPLS